MAKATDIRPKITLACEECKHRNYITKKNRRNDPDRIELKKFCPNCARAPRPPRDALSRACPTPSFVGKALPPSAPYRVSREKIREFALAIGEGASVCLDRGGRARRGPPRRRRPAHVLRHASRCR